MGNAMEMHQIKYFLTLCETLNFTQAAEQCNVAQPSLSRAIRKLEDELGGPLFYRAHNRTRCTELGNLMRPQLQKVLDASEVALLQAQKVSSLEMAQLELGVMSTIGPLQFTGFISRLRAEIPHLNLNLHVEAGPALIERMKEGRLDAAILGMPTLPDTLRAHTLYQERYVIAFSKGHRFEAMDVVPLDALTDERYLDRSNCEYTAHLEKLGGEAEPDVNVVYESDQETWIQAMLLAGLGCAIMPEYLPVLPGIVTRSLIKPDIQRNIQLITMAGRRFSPSVEVLVRLAKRYDWNRDMCA